MNTDIILRCPAIILAGFKDGMIVADMMRVIKCSYDWTVHIKKILVDLDIIVIGDYRKYKLTDKGIELHNHFKRIVEVMKIGETNCVSKD